VWRTIRDNIGWSLIIGLPILLVVLALLSKATNGFDFTPQPTPFPTAEPTVTPGSYQAPPAPSSQQKDRLLYLASDTITNPNNIYSANLDGSDARKLTDTKDLKSTPSWSPDGKVVAFAANNVGIQTVNYDGKNLRTLVYQGFAPVFSPDSKRLAFLKQSTSGTGNDLYVINVDGKPGDEKQVAPNALGPSWSPDGKTIAYFDLRNAVMFTVDVDVAGSYNQVRGPVAKNIGGWFPTFSPDGKSLIFYGSAKTAQMVQALDTGVNPLTPAPPSTVLTPVAPTTAPATTAAGTVGAGTATGSAGAGLPPAPTPTSTTRAQIGLYTVRLDDKDGSSIKQLTSLESLDAGGSSGFATFVAAAGEDTFLLSNRPSFRAAPVFSADGKQVATLEVGKQNPGLVVLNSDGSGQPTIIGEDTGLEAGLRLNPTFSTDGTKLYYLFLPTGTGKNTVVRVYDFASKKETAVVSTGDNAFATCCGFNK
jgi:Tol biopolymer transport system component